jgi:hypothetical protein
VSQDQKAVALSLDVWLHVLSHLDAQGPNGLTPLMMTCKALRTLGMPGLINSFKPDSFLKLEEFLRFLYEDLVVHIPMLRHVYCMFSVSYAPTQTKREWKSNILILGVLTSVLYRARNIQTLSLHISMLDEEPRVLGAHDQLSGRSHRTPLLVALESR